MKVSIRSTGTAPTCCAASSPSGVVGVVEPVTLDERLGVEQVVEAVEADAEHLRVFGPVLVVEGDVGVGLLVADVAVRHPDLDDRPLALAGVAAQLGGLTLEVRQ